MPVFMPVQIFETPQPFLPARSSSPPSTARPPSGLIEIELGNGRQVRVGSDVNVAALRRVLTALCG
jgi:transposase